MHSLDKGSYEGREEILSRCSKRIGARHGTRQGRARAV